MSSKEQKTAVNPIVIVTLGVVLLAIALILIIFQPNSQSLNPNAASGNWNQLMVAFITGITTGGLSCLAVQGGLLASSLAHQIEQDYVEQAANKKQKSKAPVRIEFCIFPFFFFLPQNLSHTLCLAHSSAGLVRISRSAR